jgi:hypothetical protein
MRRTIAWTRARIRVDKTAGARGENDINRRVIGRNRKEIGTWNPEIGKRNCWAATANCARRVRGKRRMLTVTTDIVDAWVPVHTDGTAEGPREEPLMLEL